MLSNGALSSAHAASPLSSVGSRPDGPAYELKFLIDDASIGAIEDWARQNLVPDPYGDPALGGAYQTTTLYLDTSRLDVYHRSPTYSRRKFRVRRYGAAPSVHLERKSKGGDRVSKRRVQVPLDDVTLLATAEPQDSWSGQWFHQRVHLKQLLPAARVTYHRAAYVGSCEEGPLRLTIDRDIRGILSNDWSLQSNGDSRLLLADKVILELKFLRSLPGPFKNLVRDFRLNPASVSKYRLCREAWDGLDADRESIRA